MVIDDDPASCRLVQAVFASDGLSVLAAHDGKSGLERARSERPDVVILDLHLPDLDGLEVLDRLRSENASTLVIMLTAHADVKTAVRAIQLGAFDYQTKPIDPEEFALVVRRAFETRALRVEVEELRRQVGETPGLAQQMGSSREVSLIVEQVRTVAATSFSVLVLGETGTGKELVVQAIHRQSDRRERPLIAVDCGAIPEGLLESELFGHEKGSFTGADRRKKGRFQVAEGGTLFLDEVGNLPLGLQSKLLRVLESRQLQAVGSTKTASVDLRFIAATNDDLQARVSAGKFRADLYFRLAQYTISVPALRERPSDIFHLAQRFLAEASVELRRPVNQIALDALPLLQRHAWPGNVRELRNLVRQGVLESSDGVLRRAQLQNFLIKANSSNPVCTRSTPGKSLKEFAELAARDAERQIICETLRETRGNKSEAARLLRTDYKTLHVKMKNLGIRARDFSP